MCHGRYAYELKIYTGSNIEKNTCPQNKLKKNGHPKTTYDYENRCHNDNEHSYFSQVAEFIQRLSNTSKDHLKVEDVIVVCNKCDLIPAENLEDAMVSAKEQIMASCQELQSQQITFLSVKEVTFKLIICLF